MYKPLKTNLITYHAEKLQLTINGIYVKFVLLNKIITYLSIYQCVKWKKKYKNKRANIHERNKQ